mgnify:CR=1 FL=1
MKLNQNLYQKIVVSINILFEFFRVITCSLLIIFVPQKCGDHVCSINEKLYLTPSFYCASLIFNRPGAVVPQSQSLVWKR